LVESGDLEQLADRFVAHLHGNAWSSAAVPTPFRDLLVGTNGWRPDGVLQVRGFLRELIAQFEERFRVKRNRGVSIATRATAVRLLWGVDEHPLSAREVIDRLKLPVSENAVRSWRRTVCGSEAALSYAQRISESLAVQRATLLNTAQRQLGRQLPRRTGWGKGELASWSKAVREWPPPGEREALAKLITGCFPVELEDIDLPDLDELGRRTGIDCFDLPIRLLRDVLEDDLQAWFSKTAATNIRVWVTNNVCDTWSGTDLLTNYVPLIDETPSGAKYADQVGTVAQMLAWSIAQDKYRLGRAAYVRDLNARGLIVITRQLLNLNGGAAGQSDVHASHRIEITPKERERLARLTSLAIDPSTLYANQRFLSGEQPTVRNGADALVLANCIRDTPDLTIKRVLIDEFSDNRAVAVSSSRLDRHRQAMAVADQSVGWDTVHLGDSARAERHRAQVSSDQPGAKWAYMSHTYRNNAVLLNKQDKYGQALGAISQGLWDVRLYIGGGLVTSAQERESSLQQLFLAAAGISVRRLESGLIKANLGHHASQTLFAQTSRAALLFTRGALDMLALLEKVGLAPTRLAAQEAGEIANQSWRAQARIIRLRALLGVRTAIVAGLIREKWLGTDANYDLPLLPLEQTKEPLGSTQVPMIIEAYRELQRLPELQPARAVDVIPLAAWLAFLNEGLLPVEDNPGELFVQRDNAPFLAHEGGTGQIPLRIDRLNDWSAHCGRDFLILSWVKHRSPVFAALSKASGGLFDAFRTTHDQNKRREWRSHD